jgi:xylulokinase
MTARLVAGIDSSTQACKVVVRELESGRTVREGRASHPPGTEVHPEEWWRALGRAVASAGGLADVAAVSVAAQQHGLVCLDDEGTVVRPALLWNDVRSAAQAEELVTEIGAAAWAESVGSVPLASFTVSKLRWLSEREPESARRVAAVCLPHDWLTSKLLGTPAIDSLVTDRGDASGTGYWSPPTGRYRMDLLERAFGRPLVVPRVLGPSEAAGETPTGTLVGAGTGDNMAAALGLGVGPGDLLVSVGSSGVVSAVSGSPSMDPTGSVAGFADATGRYLPLVCTLNAATVLDATARLLGVDTGGFDDLALAAPSGAGGLCLVPYLDGERTPNLPGATGSLLGMRHANLTPAGLARAAVEGVLCGLADGMAVLGKHADPSDSGRLLLTGGGAGSEAVRRIAPAVFGRAVLVPRPSEYVAGGAARQAAWALLGDDQPPETGDLELARYRADFEPTVLERFRRAAASAGLFSLPDGSPAR